MDNALVLFKTEPSFREELSSILNGYKVIFNENNNTGSIDAETADNTTIIFGSPKADFVKSCPRLKWVQLQSAGANGYVDGEVKQTFILTSATGCYWLAVSEHMVALTFELLKKLHLYRDEQLKGRWQDRGQVKSVRGAVVVVVGVGNIGSAYARSMKALGSHVIGIDRNARTRPDFLDEFFTSEKMDEVLPKADVLALIAPGIKANANLIGRKQLAKMKKDAVIINAGRGTLVDTEAVADALESGALGGAGLEVTEPEPLPAGHRLWKIENAVITPHVAGGPHLPETTQYIMRHCLENARRFVRGESLKSIVDFQTGYCKPESAAEIR